MADSTCTLAAPPATLTGRRDLSDPVRTDLARLVDRQLPELITTLLHGSVQRGDDPATVSPALAQLVHAAMPMVAGVCHGGKRLPFNDVVPFRLLGAACAQAQATCDDAVETVTGAVEAVADLLLARGRELDDLYGAANIEAAIADMCGDLEAFASSAARQVEYGCGDAAEYRDTRPTNDEASALLSVLSPRDDPAEHASAWEDVFPRSRRLILAVLVATGKRDDTPALARAAADMAMHVPDTVSLGLGDNAPTHWRVAILRPLCKLPWDAHPVMRQIAARNGVTIVIRQPSISLDAARTVYRDAVDALPEIIAEHGQRSAVVTTRMSTGARGPLPIAA